MKCPVCDATLRPVERRGVEVDICPDCKGVWLDRGELEKLVELAATDGTAPQRPQERTVETRRDHQDGHRDHDDNRHDNDHDRDTRGHDSRSGKPRKKGSWLGDILGGFGDD